MLQTLLRIRFDQTWSLGPLEEVSVWGFGVLLAVWAVVGIAWYLALPRRTGWRPEHMSAAIVWGIIGAVILAAPTVGMRLAPQGIPVFGYGFMLFLGFVAAGWTASRPARSIGLDGELIWDLAMWIFFLGILGARVFHLVQYHERVFAGKSGLGLVKAAINLPDGGLVLYGGVILGIVGYIVFCRRRKLDALLLADVAMPSVFLGVALGRIGCLLNGCCYGDRCELPWAITFPRDSVPYVALVKRGFLDPDALYSLPLHPTQIYSSIDALVLALLTAAYFRYRHRNGAVLALGWLTYPITRFSIEYLRGDELGKFHTSLTISQWVSIGLFLSALVYVAWLSRQPKPDSERRFETPLPRGAQPT